MAVPYEFVKSFINNMDTKLFSMYSKAVDERIHEEHQMAVSSLIQSMPQNIQAMIKNGQLIDAQNTLAEHTGHNSIVCKKAILAFRNIINGTQENDPLD